MTSGTRRASAAHSGHGKVTSSTYGRCGSSPARSWPASPPSGQGPDAGQVAVRAFPQRKRRAPVPRPGQRPVHVVAQPLAVAAFLDRHWLPVGLPVLREQLVLDRGGPDVPGGQRVVQQHGVAPPAVRVTVRVRLGPEQQVTAGQVGGQRRVRVLEEHPADDRQVLLEPPVRPHRVDHGQAVDPGDLHVIGSEGRGDVHQARSVLGGHEVASDHDVGVRDVHQRERTVVGGSQQFRPADGGDCLPALAKHPVLQGLGHHDLLAAAGSGDHVLDLRVNRHGGVGNQRPGRRRPDQQAGAGQGRAGSRGTEASGNRTVTDGSRTSR